jgi:hypothetical protein
VCVWIPHGKFITSLPPSNGSVKITKVGYLDTLVMFTTLVNLFVLEFNEGNS